MGQSEMVYSACKNRSPAPRLKAAAKAMCGVQPMVLLYPFFRETCKQKAPPPSGSGADFMLGKNYSSAKYLMVRTIWLV